MSLYPDDAQPSTSGTSKQSSDDHVEGKQVMIDKNNIYNNCKIIKTEVIKECSSQNHEFDLPSSSENFVGRKKEFKELDELFVKHREIVITGFAGLGKTRLAVEYAKRKVKAKKYSKHYYVVCETEEVAMTKLKTLGQKLLNKQEDGNDKILILDNLTDATNIRNLLSNINDVRNIKVLATSQKEFPLFKQFKLTKLEREEGVTLVLKLVEEIRKVLEGIHHKAAHLFSIDETDEIEQLVDELDCHPLALKHATAVIYNTSIYNEKKFCQNIENYLKEFLSSLDEEFPADFIDLDYTKTSFNAIKINLKRATKKQHVRDFLYCTAFFDPTEINLKLFYEVGCFKKEQVEEATEILLQHSIMEKNSSFSFAFQVHRLVPIVSLKMMQEQNVEEQIIRQVFRIYFSRSYSLSFDTYILNNIKLNANDLEKIYIEAFHDTSRSMQTLSHSLDRIAMSINDVKEKWTAAHYCLFTKHDGLSDYFRGAADHDEQSDWEGEWPYAAVRILRGDNLTIRNNSDFKRMLSNVTHFRCYVAFYDGYDFKFLLNKRIDISIEEKISLLNMVTRNKCYDYGYQLIKIGANYDNIGEDKALMCAVAGEDLELAERLIKNNANVNFQDEEGCSPIYYSIPTENAELFSLLVENGARIDWKLEMRIFKSEMLLLLFGHYLDSNRFKTFGNGRTLRRIAHNLSFKRLRETDALKKMKYLIDSGAAVNGSDYLGRTPLMLAIERKFENCAKLLIEKNDDIDKEDKNDKTALMYALEAGLENVAMLLINKNADIYRVTKFGETPLMYALEGKLENLAKLLIDKNGDFHKVNRWGKTTLIYALEKKMENVALQLIEKKVDVNKIPHLFGRQTALDVAKRNDLHTAVGKLIAAGAKTYEELTSSSSSF